MKRRVVERNPVSSSWCPREREKSLAVKQFPPSFSRRFPTGCKERQPDGDGRAARNKGMESKSDHDDEDCHECPGIRPAGAENLTEFSSRTRRRATQISPSASSASPGRRSPCSYPQLTAKAPCASELLPSHNLQTPMQQWRARGG